MSDRPISSSVFLFSSTLFVFFKFIIYKTKTYYINDSGKYIYTITVSPLKRRGTSHNDRESREIIIKHESGARTYAF